LSRSQSRGHPKPKEFPVSSKRPSRPVDDDRLQLAFKVSVVEVDHCAGELARQNVKLLSPPTDQSFGHRTLFFRDPDGNLLEIFAEI